MTNAPTQPFRLEQPEEDSVQATNTPGHLRVEPRNADGHSSARRMERVFGNRVEISELPLSFEVSAHGMKSRRGTEFHEPINHVEVSEAPSSSEVSDGVENERHGTGFDGPVWSYVEVNKDEDFHRSHRPHPQLMDNHHHLK